MEREPMGIFQCKYFSYRGILLLEERQWEYFSVNIMLKRNIIVRREPMGIFQCKYSCYRGILLLEESQWEYISVNILVTEEYYC